MSQFPHQPDPLRPRPEDDLNSAQLPVSREHLENACIPAVLKFPALDLDSAACVLENLLIDEDGHYSIDSEQLATLLQRAQDGAPIANEDLVGLVPCDDALAIRQVSRSQLIDGQIRDLRFLEIQRIRDQAWTNPTITLAFVADGRGVRVEIDWTATLLDHSDESLYETWDNVESLIESTMGKKIDDMIVTVDEGLPTQAKFGSIATLVMIEKDQVRANPLENPNLSLDPYFQELCAIRGEDAPHSTIADRIQLISERLANLTNTAFCFQSKNIYAMEREDLLSFGHDRVLDPSSTLELIEIEGYLLLATSQSTGASLMADLEQLSTFEKDYSASQQVCNTQVRYVEIADPSEKQLSGLLSACSLACTPGISSKLLELAPYETARDKLHLLVQANPIAAVTSITEHLLSVDEDGENCFQVARSARISFPSVEPLVQTPTITLESNEHRETFPMETTPKVVARVCYGPSLPQKHDEVTIPGHLLRKLFEAVDIDPSTSRLDLPHFEDTALPSFRGAYLSRRVRILY